MKFTALVHNCSEEGESGFAALCAEIPNAVGQGETLEGCLADLQTCIEFVLEENRRTAIETAGPDSQTRELVFS